MSQYTAIEKEIDVSPGITKSRDGLVRLTLSALDATSLSHLVSGLDEESWVQKNAEGAYSTTITGYTEWLGETDVPLSIGWDWYLDVTLGDKQYKRMNLPRSNVVLVNNRGKDLGYQMSNRLLSKKIDNFYWQETVVNYISE